MDITHGGVNTLLRILYGVVGGVSLYASYTLCAIIIKNFTIDNIDIKSFKSPMLAKELIFCGVALFVSYHMTVFIFRLVMYGLFDMPLAIDVFFEI